MKIELIKETDCIGEVWYHIHVDGFPMMSTQDLEIAEEYYGKIKEGNGVKREVLKSETL